MISFIKDTKLEVIDSFDEVADEVEDCHYETFKAGEPVDAEIVDEDAGHVHLQFGSGGVAFGVERSMFVIIPEKVVSI